MNRHKKNVSLGIFNVSSLFHMEGGKNRGKTIWASKKIDINLLGYWNNCELELVAFLLFPHPGVHFTLCLLCSGGWQSPLSSKAAAQKAANKSPSGCGPASVFLEQRVKWIPICQWQKVLWAVLKTHHGQVTMTRTVFLHCVALQLSVKERSFGKTIKGTLPKK